MTNYGKLFKISRKGVWLMINGSSVLFPATPGTEYPKKAIFYGN